MKIQKVQNFDQFTSQKIEEANDSFFSFDFLGNLFNKGFDAFTDVLKNKVIAHLLEYLGIGEGTILSKLVQNFVEQIEVKDYYAILFKSKMNARYLAPKAANATMEFLVENGFNDVAKALGVTDTNGYVYRTIQEGLVNEVTRKDFAKRLESFYLMLFGGVPEQSVEIFQKSLKPQEKTKLQNDLVTKAKSAGIKAEKPEEKNAMLTNFFANIGSLNQANPTQIATTAGEDLFTSLIQPTK
jgi:hypothetical protein